jgi:hypothetical protein
LKKYKAKSEKGKQLEAEINRFKQEEFQAKHKQTVKQAHKGLNYKRKNNN